MSHLNKLVMPKLGLTMTEGLLSEWYVGPGDSVKAGDGLFVVETDKVATDITAEADGEIKELLIAVGDTVPVGAVVAYWTGPGQGMTDEVVEDDPTGAEPAPAAVDAAPATAPDPAASAGRVVATPLARRLARERGVELNRISGTGPRGRIKAADIRATASAQPESIPEALTPAKAERQPASNLAQAMARRMVEAKQSVPHFYLSAEAEVSELLVLRQRLNNHDGWPRLTLNHFIVLAVARALEALPQQNRIWLQGEIVQFENVDVGVAVSTKRGLLAPVLHDLAGCALDDVAARASELVERVHEGKASPKDMEGGAITISNAGMFDVTYMTPIINPPQSAILGVGSIRELFRPSSSGEPTLKREMGLVLAGDHRLHDGASGLKFLNCVIDLLQDPYQLLRSRNVPHRG